MVGVLMNAGALMALMVINVGLDVGILNSTAFFMLVMVAVITTFMTAPLLRIGLKRAPKTSLAHIPRWSSGGRSRRGRSSRCLASRRRATHDAADIGLPPAAAHPARGRVPAAIAIRLGAAVASGDPRRQSSR
jgi:hypothetical protein